MRGQDAAGPVLGRGVLSQDHEKDELFKQPKERTAQANAIGANSRELDGGLMAMKAPGVPLGPEAKRSLARSRRSRWRIMTAFMHD